MIKVTDRPVYLLDGNELSFDAQGTSYEDAQKGTVAYSILRMHNTSGNMEELKLRFDRLISHDGSYADIIQTARACGMQEFPVPYILTNCHNSTCAAGGSRSEDGHVYGLSCAKRYGGVYVPPYQAVMHQFAREKVTTCGGMIMGSDRHARYGSLGTMGISGEDADLVRQLMGETYDIAMPDVLCVYLTGRLAPGVGPQDAALALIGAVGGNGFAKGKIMEFTGPGIADLTADFRLGIDMMTAETGCLSTIWQTDRVTRGYYDVHERLSDFRPLRPQKVAGYAGLIEIDLDEIQPMISFPFLPGRIFTIEDFKADADVILHEMEEAVKETRGLASFDLHSKIRNGRFLVDQGIVAGSAGGGFENICDMADILDGADIGNGAFSLTVYPASMPIYMELVKNGTAAKLLECGAVLKAPFCGPCFGAVDIPASGAFSIRHATWLFPNEGIWEGAGDPAVIALMDSRSIAATAANQGILTAATDLDVWYMKPKYFFDGSIYRRRVFNSCGVADPSVEVIQGPDIPDLPPLPEFAPADSDENA